ncbi:hypothetical protein ABZY29_16060, partial [Streptomyces coeruleorubidus]
SGTRSADTQQILPTEHPTAKPHNELHSETISYWSVPMDSAAVLCTPLAVARLIAAGRHCLDPEPEA